MYGISYYLPDLTLIISFTLPPCYDMLIGIWGLYRQLGWVRRELEGDDAFGFSRSMYECRRGSALGP
jgi:hypothetical protein